MTILAQHREMKRRDAAKANELEPKFGLLWWSWTWNWISLAAFVFAVLAALWCLSAVSLGNA
jgi:hypothetical protein